MSCFNVDKLYSLRSLIIHEIVVFLNQKTAYEIYCGLVGSEMCIRDSDAALRGVHDAQRRGRAGTADQREPPGRADRDGGCLLYTSDAADERSRVDIGGRRIIKKKTNQHHDVGAV